MKNRFFAELVPELATRATRATLGRLGFSNPALRAHLTKVFSQQVGKPGSYLGEPVFEATFGWEQAAQSMEQLGGSLLAEKTVVAMDAPAGESAGAYRFPRSARPYQHQLEAWRFLGQSQARSVVVTSGTGSGKTECFMVPILDSLVREHLVRPQKLVGVRALFLYPLNALIQSQQERLDAWTAAFDGDIRFALYNGNTPETEPQHRRKQRPNQVIDREDLRASPPPILVTNATMLEYMLVRAVDANILAASQGQLKWIVLDEAHTYIGSQAAELALLLRRVLHAFGVHATDVRFVATSATIGGEDAARQLQMFLARLAGLPSDRVHVVSGRRQIPDLTDGDHRYARATLEELEALSNDQPDAKYAALCGSETARRLRQLFVTEAGRARQLRDVDAHLFGATGVDSPDRQALTLRWLDLLTSSRCGTSKDATPFLPLRLHIFHNVLAGLWACADPACPCKSATDLASPDWPFGKVYIEERRHCECGAPVFELRSCGDCNTTYLWAERKVDRRTGAYKLAHMAACAEDEFALDVESADEDEQDERSESSDSPLLIANGHRNGTGVIRISRSTLELDPKDASDVLELRVRDESQVNEAGEFALVCPECGGHHQARPDFFRRAILGAPFLLGEIIPTLLEYCPDLDEKGGALHERPWRGRRMITFTDSRQGTARIAAKLQQDSERNAVRSLIYRRMVQAGRRAGDAQEQKLRAEIETLSAVAAQIPAVAALVRDKEAELVAMSATKPVPWREIASWLVTNEAEVRDWIYDFYSDLDPQLFKPSGGRELLANILTMREIARRPKRVNSPETMGLLKVCYPKLDGVKAAPAAGGFTLDEWKDVLKIALDFWVRENTFINLPEDSWKKWGGNRLSRKWLLPPTSTEQQTNKYKRWPQCNTGGVQSRLVRLLAYVLGLDPESPLGRDTIDSLLRKAWEDLVSVELLMASSQGRFLQLDDIALAPMTKGWLCPVTRRVLDVTLRGVTPYLPRKDLREKYAKCKALEIPLCEAATADYDSDDVRVQTIRAWLNQDPTVQTLRAEGVWSDLNDRVLEGARYFRAAEHSAQQSGLKLQAYERDFKSGRINLLSCSTTMEMGVDIGGISVVAMNNVPPHPANYLQRAGRAGRRAETRSIALTVCKSNPHDQSVLRNTLWPFVTRLPAPSVMLSSALIVQRHVNSLLLAHFLKREIGHQGTVEKLNLEWWMLPAGSAPVERFCSWAECFDATAEKFTAEGIAALTKHTCHEGLADLRTLTREAARMVRQHQEGWFAEYAVVQSQLANFTGAKEKNPAYKALSMQSGRLTGEYLLRELATGGVLPGYSFPSDIASLDTLTAEELSREKARKQTGLREDNAYRRRELPSRDVAVALREYAPGAEVVIDGLVYRSGGITLNWHAPTSLQAAAEIQNLRRAWRCKRCGSSGTAISAVTLSHCPDCGAALVASEQTLFDYLDPAGFAVDLYSVPHNDVAQQTYVPVQRPWIDARGEWRPLSNPTRGLFRVSEQGTVFHYSDGGQGEGYAVCLHCGRAEPMPAGSSLLPDVFQDHKTGQIREHRRLRGAEGGETAVCSGSHVSFAVKPNLRLGHESTTDVLEILLYGLDGAPLNDVRVAYSIAVALRAAIASLLGVETSELGCETKPVQLDGASTGQAIVVFDQNGSGYSSSVADRLDQIIRDAASQLACEANCPDACQHCLLQFDTRYRIDHLGRHAARAFISDAWLQSLRLPSEHQHFGAASGVEWQNVPEAITRTLARPGARRIRIFLNGAVDDWDIAGSPLRHYVRRWADTPIELIASAKNFERYASVDDIALRTLAALDGITLQASDASFKLPTGGVLVAEVVFEDGGSIAWASTSGLMGRPDAAWGERAGHDVLVSGEISTGELVGDCKRFALPVSSARTPTIARLDLTHELDGPLQGFGGRLVSAVLQASGKDLLQGDVEIRAITYCDRYLKNPLSSALLVETIAGLKAAFPDQWALNKFRLVTLPIDGDRLPSRAPATLRDDWLDTEMRTSALMAAFAYCGIDAEIMCRPKEQTPHARSLLIELASGKALRFTLDQGFSSWRVSRSSHPDLRYRMLFDFKADAARQGELIANMAVTVEGPDLPTYVIVDRI